MKVRKELHQGATMEVRSPDQCDQNRGGGEMAEALIVPMIHELLSHIR